MPSPLIKVYSWNIADLPDFFRKKFPVDRRYRAIADQVADADVVCFQEVFSTYRKLKKLLKKRGFKHFKRSGRRLFGLVVWPSGTLIALKERKFFYAEGTFEHTNGFFSNGNDQLAAKGYQVFKYRGHWFVHTHMDAGSSPDDIRARRGQLLELEDAMTRLVEPREPTIVLGDFNLKDFRYTQTPRAYADTANRERFKFDAGGLVDIIYHNVDGAMASREVEVVGTPEVGHQVNGKISDHPYIEFAVKEPTDGKD